MVVCEYGCKEKANFQLKNKKWCCSKSSNQCKKVREKNSAKAIKAHSEGKKYIFTNEARNVSIRNRKDNLKNKPFNEWGRKLQEELILKEQCYKCLECGTSKDWFGKQLIFELDHIDGNRNNNSRNNLRILCPNCHSTTDTWRGRNTNTGIKKVSDEDILSELKKGKNIRQILIGFNLAPKGGNYQRVKKLSAQSETVDVELVKFGESLTANTEPSL